MTITPLRDYSKSLRRKWNRRLRAHGLPWAFIRKFTHEGAAVVEGPNGLFIDYLDGRAFSVSASGRSADGFLYCVEKARKGERYAHLEHTERLYFARGHWTSEPLK